MRATYYPSQMNRRPIIYTIPFAGGSSYSFYPLIKAVDHALEVRPLEYPGRGQLMGEDLVSDANTLAEVVFEQLRRKLDGAPYAMLGHSMGCLVNILVTRLLVEFGLPLPVHLFMSAMAGPSRLPQEDGRHLLSGDEFWSTVESMGGTPKEVTEDEAIRDFFEPILKSDFKALDTYVYTPGVVLDIPISVMFGRSDKIEPETAQLWQRETSRPIDIRMFEGGHFFLFEKIDETAPYICQAVEETLRHSQKPEKSNPRP